MIRFLLDTDVCIEVIRGRGKGIRTRLQRLEPGDCGLSAITLAELQYGVQRSANPERNLLALLQFCAPFEIRPFDDDAAAHYGKIRAELEQRGSVIGMMDMLIAAQGLADGATVVTNNLRDFRRVPDLLVSSWE